MKPALWSAAAIAAILAAFVFVRLPLLTREASARGWNGDGAIFGLMAKRIHDGKGFDVFFWGQNYMGPLTPALAAGIRRTMLDPAGLGAEGGPIALRLASMSEIAFGICLYVLAFTRLFGRAIAAFAGLWVAIGPPFFIRLSALNRSTAGPEMSFFLGSVLFFLAAGALTRPRSLLDRPARLFVLGLLAGVGWWMNQTIVFILLPVAALVFLRSALSWRLSGRLLTPMLCGGALGYSPVLLGRLLGWYDPAEGPYITPWVSSGLAPRLVRFLGEDSWRVIGLDGVASPPLLAAVSLVLLSLLLMRVARRPGSPLRTEGIRFDGLDLVGAVVVLGAAVSFLKNFDPAGDRYLAPVLPAAVAFLLVAVAEAANLLRRRIPPALVTLVLGGLALAATLFLWRQARGVVAGLLLEPDPRAPLKAIAEEGYRVCHASYDAAYVLQFLSDERVRFIPYHSVDRNRMLSAELRSIPGPQCLVTDDGVVRRWLPSDAAEEGGPVRRRVGEALRR